MPTLNVKEKGLKMKDVITSPQNQQIKSIIDLQKSRIRKKSSRFGVEGTREISMALKNNFKLEQVFYCPELFNIESKLLLKELSPKTKRSFEISSNCFEKIAVRKESDGLYALFQKKEEAKLERIKSPDQENLFLVLDGLEKPGNLGAILRSCDAAKVSAIILTNPKVDLYNPHVIRSSLGACFSMPLLVAEISELNQFFNEKKVSVFLSYLDKSSKVYYKENLKQATALVIGSESHGICSDWLQTENKRIIIPMSGQVDSLNASVATSVLLFETQRQRSIS